ncbi:Chromosome partition protein Smc [Carpediemonas membranifera]|uniref:Chromosome partition protein Smc n=1 Tax=Carpediemonas membranifera TaxID=201153 RepID=A0A8J6E1X1_9EUKA|nr:Chromosome partition protein Smc [Carpediemonas membranifera]|eukprot:KAG9396894.1 Chromosome partition protein Smc [Carpediemonas membranifera]
MDPERAQWLSALKILDKWAEDAPPDEKERRAMKAELFRSQFQRLYDCTVLSMAGETQSMDALRSMKDDRNQSEADLEAATEKATNAKLELEKYQDELRGVEVAIRKSQDDEELLEIQIDELNVDRDAEQALVDENETEVRAIYGPRIKQIQDEMELTKDMMRDNESTHKKLTAEIASSTARIEEVEAINEALKREVSAHREAVERSKTEPTRLKKTADLLQQAMTGKQAEERKYLDQLVDIDRQLEDEGKTLKKNEERRAALQSEIQLAVTAVEGRDEEVRAVTQHVAKLKRDMEDRMAQRVKLELEIKAKERASRQAQEALSKAEKALGAEEKVLRGVNDAAGLVRQSIPEIKSQIANLKKELASARSSLNKMTKEREEIGKDVDVGILKLLQTEDGNAKQGSNLQAALEGVKEREAILNDLMESDRALQAELVATRAQRSTSDRDMQRVMGKLRSTVEALQGHEAVIVDLTKRHSEMLGQLKSFGTLYESVKTQRNKYLSFIQSTQQAQAELVERLKVLSNEVEILTGETRYKDATLRKDRAETAQIIAVANSCRHDVSRLVEQRNILRDEMDSNVAEVERSSASITSAERDILGLKKSFVDAAEGRDSAGIALLERNDELCVLHEKCNLQASVLLKGQKSLVDLDVRAKHINLLIRDYERKVELAKKIGPEISKYEEQIHAMLAERDDLLVQGEELAKKLVDPNTEGRWRSLEKPTEAAEDRTTLLERQKDLESKILIKDNQIQEQMLVIDEIDNLIAGLKQAVSTQSDTRTTFMSDRVNRLRSSVDRLNKKLQSRVAELSMYQAEAKQYEPEVKRLQTVVQTMKDRMDNSLPPTDTAEREWEAMQVKKAEEKAAKAMAARRTEVEELDGTITTAVPRPNAYKYDGEASATNVPGISKPYPAPGPMMPSEYGANMRHFRAPRQRGVEL